VSGIRRIVTGVNKDGRSMVKWDSEIKDKSGRFGFKRTDIWATDSLPVKLSEDDPAKWNLGTTLSNGSVFRLIRYEPGVLERWHVTDSIDYAVILSGEIWMQLDEEEVHLRTGDVVIQRSTKHNWVNRGKEPCIIAFVLIATEGAKPTAW